MATHLFKTDDTLMVQRFESLYLLLPLPLNVCTKKGILVEMTSWRMRRRGTRPRAGAYLHSAWI